MGIRGVREGVPWYRIDRRGRYDFRPALPLVEAATREGVPATVLQQAARRGIINAWRDNGVQYVSRAEVAVFFDVAGNRWDLLGSRYSS